MCDVVGGGTIRGSFNVATGEVGQVHKVKVNSLRIKTFFSGWHGIGLDR